MSNSPAITAAAFICALALATSHCSVALAQDNPDDFLRAHNGPRRWVGVPDVVWDPDLERQARDAAALCDFSNGARLYGENLYWVSGTGAHHAATAVASWVAERAYYHCRSNTCSAPPGETCDHYTQVVSHRTERIGCAREVCRGHRGSSVYYFVCKYDPAGNVGGRPYRCR